MPNSKTLQEFNKNLWEPIQSQSCNSDPQNGSSTESSSYGSPQLSQNFVRRNLKKREETEFGRKMGNNILKDMVSAPLRGRAFSYGRCHQKHARKGW